LYVITLVMAASCLAGLRAIFAALSPTEEDMALKTKVQKQSDELSKAIDALQIDINALEKEKKEKDDVLAVKNKAKRQFMLYNQQSATDGVIRHVAKMNAEINPLVMEVKQIESNLILLNNQKIMKKRQMGMRKVAKHTIGNVRRQKELVETEKMLVVNNSRNNNRDISTSYMVEQFEKQNVSSASIHIEQQSDVSDEVAESIRMEFRSLREQSQPKVSKKKYTVSDFDTAGSNGAVDVNLTSGDIDDDLERREMDDLSDLMTM